MLTKLTAAQLAARPDYVLALQGLAVGEGGMATTAGEDTSKITIKNRLTAAAQAASVSIKFHRSDDKTVIFEVVGPGNRAGNEGPLHGQAARPEAEDGGVAGSIGV
ncbi:MAG: hypothetical protein IPG72_16170 [Ardenticatenales bacterium]|nr:hypothetical protein [Ardenticatenales bacterium]